MKRIAHYAPNIWANGGIASYIRRLGRAQEEAGYEVTYFSQRPVDAAVDKTIVVADDQQLFALAKERAIDILHLHKPVYVLPDDRVTTVRTMHGNQGSCPAGTRFLARSEKPCNRSYSIPGCFASHIVERCGSLRYAKVKRNFGGIRNEHRIGVKIHTFTVSRFLKDWMLKSGYPEKRLHVLNSPAPDNDGMPAPPPEEGVPRFLFLGRLVPQKGAQWLFRALAKVKSNVKIDVGGDGPMQRELEAFCSRRGLSDKVTFHGWVQQEQVKQLLESARAVVVPSIWQEPAGLVTLEAAAAGRAVIASRAGGIPEYAMDEYSLLVQPNDTRQLADAIDRLANEYDRAKKMGECGLRNAQTRYSMVQFMEKQVALYHRAVEESALQIVESQEL